ncbi:unnamed protein product [Symbiodinium sp. KB8]|nr:unnamed protein product [Symbiodinium sp. KB8]
MIESVQKLHAVVPLLSRSLAQDGRRLVVRAWKSPRDVEESVRAVEPDNVVAILDLMMGRRVVKVTEEIEALELKLAILEDKVKCADDMICEGEFTRGQAVVYINQHYGHNDHSSAARTEVQYQGCSTYRMVSHGGVHGITRATTEQKSKTASFDIGTDLHRDGNNLKNSSNYCATFGQEQGGQLWLEAKDVNEAQADRMDRVNYELNLEALWTIPSTVGVWNVAEGAR